MANTNTRIYNIPLRDASADRPEDTVAAQIATQGLIEQGGIASEKIAAENVDLVLSGQIRRGEVFSPKVATELESLAASTYSGLPIYYPDATDSGRDRGYYELESLDVSQVQAASEDVFEYTLGLSAAGTIDSEWRAVTTAAESIETGLTDGGAAYVGVPDTSGKERWYDVAHGSTRATPAATVATEFGNVDLFDLADAPSTYTNPTLLYETPYTSEGPRDVRVYDDRDLSRYKTYTGESGGGTYGSGTYGTGVYGGTRTLEVLQWVHVYHDGYEFDGKPVADNGRLRLTFDEAAGAIDAERWLAGPGWEDVTLDLSPYELFDADLTRVNYAESEWFVEFEDTNDGSIDAAVLSLQRGLDSVVVRDPDNGDVPADLESVLDPIASDQDTDPNPTQTLRSRSDL